MGCAGRGKARPEEGPGTVAAVASGWKSGAGSEKPGAGSKKQEAAMANAWMESRLGQALGEVGVPAPTRVTWVDIAARYLA